MRREAAVVFSQICIITVLYKIHIPSCIVGRRLEHKGQQLGGGRKGGAGDPLRRGDGRRAQAVARPLRPQPHVSSLRYATNRHTPVTVLTHIFITGPLR